MRFLRSFREHSELYECLDDMLARADSVSLRALSRSDLRELALLLLRVDCAVLCVLCMRSKEAKKIRKVRQLPGNKILVGNYRRGEYR